MLKDVESQKWAYLDQNDLGSANLHSKLCDDFGKPDPHVLELRALPAERSLQGAKAGQGLLWALTSPVPSVTADPMELNPNEMPDDPQPPPPPLSHISLFLAPCLHRALFVCFFSVELERKSWDPAAALWPMAVCREGLSLHFSLALLPEKVSASPLGMFKNSCGQFLRKCQGSPW